MKVAYAAFLYEIIISGETIMKELSMHILDIIMNSIKAQAKLIELIIDENTINNYIKITVKDNGKGMNREELKQVTSPFFTTRKTRKVGLGISLLKEACERCNGYLEIDSEENKGTVVECYFERDNIDRAPLGNMGDTVLTVINGLNSCEFIYKYIFNDKNFTLNTVEIKEKLGELKINDSNVLMWIKEYVEENTKEIKEK